MEIKKIAKKYNLHKKDLIRRLDGRVEWICEHGVGHTIEAPKIMGESGLDHGCDGCCNNIIEEKEE